MAYPIMLGHLGHVLTGIADSAMVGQVGSVSLAAASLANGIFMVLLTFGIGISMGLSPLVATAAGKKDHSTNSIYLKNGLVILGGVGLILFVILSLLAPFLHLLNQPEAVVDKAIPYFQILALSLFPLMIFQHYKQFAEGLSFTKMAMLISLFSNILNIILNYILIFGELGFPRMELMGAGYATLISRIVMALLMFLYVFRGSVFAKFRSGFSLSHIKKGPVLEILRIGVPIGFQFVFEVGAFVFAAIMIGWIGTAQLAAHQIAISLASLSYMAASGIAAATTVRVGYYRGRNDIRSLRTAAFSSMAMVTSFMFICALIFISLNELLPVFFTPEAAVQKIAASLLVIAAIFQLSDGMQVVGLGILRGMKDVKIPTYLTLFAYWILGLPSGYLIAFVFKVGVEGIWFGYVIGLSTAAAVLFLRFNMLSKKLRKQVYTQENKQTPFTY